MWSSITFLPSQGRRSRRDGAASMRGGRQVSQCAFHLHPPGGWRRSTTFLYGRGAPAGVATRAAARMHSRPLASMSREIANQAWRCAGNARPCSGSADALVSDQHRMTRSRPSLRRPVHPRVARAEQRPERIRSPGRIAEMIVRHAAVLVVMLVIALAALVRLRLADVPLERDEGEYAYAGQLILKGVPPYLEAYNMKFPGTYYAYALVMALFGQTARGIHVGLMLVNTGTALIVFATARRLAGDLCAAIAATAFVLLSLDRGILGIFAHATHFVLLPALGGLLLLLVARESERLWPSLAGGTLLGAAVLMKQHALVFVPLGVGLIAWPTTSESRASWRRTTMKAALLCIGTTLPLGIVAALLYRQGVLDRFWLWAIRYAKEYVSEVPLSFAWTVLSYRFAKVTQSTLVLWLVAAVGLVALALDRWPPLTRFFIFGLLATSFLGVCPGYYFREHYIY